MEMFSTLPPALALVLGLILLAWLALLFLVPFIVEGIRGWTRRSHRELQDINRKLDRLNALLTERENGRAAARKQAGNRPAPRPAAPPRTRREPTISGYPPVDAGRADNPTARHRPPASGKRPD